LPPTRLEFRGVTRRFPVDDRQEGGRGHLTAVEDVSFSVMEGEVVSIIGPSGCGKSTLLNLASGLDRPSKGEVYVDEERVNGPNPHVAFMLQKDLLLPWRTIERNVELGLEIQGIGRTVRRERARQLLRKCHIGGFERHYPHQLSGGMRQRAALARTMAMDPDVILLDEPFSAVDAQTKMVLQNDFAETISESGKTAVFITHDLTEAVTLSDRVLIMSARPGKIIKEMTIDMPDRDNPLRRQKNDNVGGYVGQLMDVLHINGAGA